MSTTNSHDNMDAVAHWFVVIRQLHTPPVMHNINGMWIADQQGKKEVKVLERVLGPYGSQQELGEACARDYAANPLPAISVELLGYDGENNLVYKRNG